MPPSLACKTLCVMLGGIGTSNGVQETNRKKDMLKAIGGILLLCVGGFAIMFYMVGNHGHLMFRPHMTEDWIIWGIALIAATTGIFLLIKSKHKSEKVN